MIGWIITSAGFWVVCWLVWGYLLRIRPWLVCDDQKEICISFASRLSCSQGWVFVFPSRQCGTRLFYCGSRARTEAQRRGGCKNTSTPSTSSKKGRFRCQSLYLTFWSRLKPRVGISKAKTLSVSATGNEC